MTSTPTGTVIRIAALDLASRKDFSALSIGDVIETGSDGAYRLDVVDLRRFQHGSYAGQVDKIADILHDPRVGNLYLGYDFGGVGAAVAELIQKRIKVTHQCGYQWVGGMHDGYNNGVKTISKQNNVHLLQRLLGEGRLGLPNIPERRALLDEMREFRVVVSPLTGHESFSSPTGKHDDMVMSLLLLAHMADEYRPSSSCGIW
jgi:hypothetical protein